MSTSRPRPRARRPFTFFSSVGLALSFFATLVAPGRDAAAQPAMIMAMGQAGGQPNDVVTVELLLFTAIAGAGDPLRVAGLDLTLHWDPTLAALEDVALTDATQGWLFAANRTPSAVSVSMATIEPASATSAGLPVLAFTFRLLDMVGQSPLHLTDTRAYDLEQAFIEHIPVDGQLDVGIVGAGAATLGAVKRAFAPH